MNRRTFLLTVGAVVSLVSGVTASRKVRLALHRADQDITRCKIHTFDISQAVIGIRWGERMPQHREVGTLGVGDGILPYMPHAGDAIVWSDILIVGARV